MANPPVEPTRAPPKTTDAEGVGQSGYTAGRTRDLALEQQIHTRNVAYRRGDEDEAVRNDLDTDERFSGRGGTLPDDAAAG